MTRTRTPSYKCSDCNKTFSTIVGVMAHGTAKGHTVPFEESPFSVYPKARLGLVECHPCKRGFIDQETLSKVRTWMISTIICLTNIYKHVRSSPLHSPSFCEQCQKWLKDEFMLKEVRGFQFTFCVAHACHSTCVLRQRIDGLHMCLLHHAISYAALYVNDGSKRCVVLTT